MRFGEANGQLDAEFNPFTDEYLGEILEAVAMAWARMKHPKSSEIEIRITRKLAAQLRHDPVFRNLPFDVCQEYILDNLDAEYLGRLDLHIKYRRSQRDYFAFEAKRLHLRTGGIPSSEYLTYVGNKGMGGYIEGPYSDNLPVAGMIAYVMDANTDTAWLGLGAKIVEKQNDLCLRADSRLEESALVDRVRHALTGTRLGETHHDLKTRILRIFHMLLPVISK